MNSIKVLIIDDHKVVIEGLQRMFEFQKKYEIIASFTKVKDFIEFVDLNEQKPDIIITDSKLDNNFNCIELKKSCPILSDLPWVVYSSFVDDFLIVKLKNNKFSGCISKDSSAEYLFEYLDNILNAESFISRNFINENKINGFSSLTKREFEILEQIKIGLNTKDIADKLCISLHTLMTHKKNIYRKLEINSTEELMILLYQN